MRCSRRVPVGLSRLPATLCWWSVAWCAGVLAAPAWGQVVPEAAPREFAEEEKVEQFLDRIGLVSYQLLQLERLLDAAPTREQSQKYARRLADLYAGQLLSLAEDEAGYRTMMERIEQLVTRHPQANTPALEVMLLQADFQRAENLVSRWMSERDLLAHQEASTLLHRLAPLLAQHHKNLKAAAERQELELDQATGSQAETLQRELTRTQELRGRAAFLGGWAHYYLGLVQAETTTPFQTARDLFRTLLGIEDYADLEPDWLGLESAGRARALIGLGLAEAALENLEASRTCFQLLEHGSVAPAIRDQAQQWYVRGLLYGGKLAEAHEFASRAVESLAGQSTPGKVSLCVVLAREGFHETPLKGATTLPMTDTARDLRKQLGVLGLVGLARLGEITLLRELIEKYDVRLEASQDDFFLSWIQGQQALDVARKSRRPEDFRAAVKALEGALETPNANADVRSTSQCRIQLAWCQFQLGLLQQAAQQYALAASGRQALGDPEGAVRNLWNAFVAYEKAARNDPRLTTPALDILKRIQQEHPNHEYAAKARYQVSRLQRNVGTPDEAMRRLEAIEPSDENYLAARVDLNKLLHEQWAKSTSALEKQRAGEKLRDSVDKYLAALPANGSPAGADAEQQLAALVFAADTLLRGGPSDGASAERYLGRAAPLLERISDESPVKREYHYRQLLAARLRKDDSAVSRHAEWLADHAAGSPYEEVALVLAAQQLEKRIAAAAPGEERQQLFRKARGLYLRLVAAAGDDPAVLAKSRNAQVAVSRLARCHAELGEHARAAEQLQHLLKAFPNERSYLRRAALALYEAADYQASVEHWRTLLRGLADENPEWFEAKYYQIACLSQTDPPQAQRVYKQFKLLHPQLGPEPWRGKFEDWARRAGGD